MTRHSDERRQLERRAARLYERLRTAALAAELPDDPAELRALATDARRQLQLHKGDRTGVYRSERLGLVLMKSRDLTTDRQGRLRTRPCWMWVHRRWINVANPGHATMNGALAQMAIALRNDDLQ